MGKKGRRIWETGKGKRKNVIIINYMNNHKTIVIKYN